MPTNSSDCPDCSPSRRTFLKNTAAFSMAAMAGSHLLADEAPKAADPETLVTSLFKTLTEDQKKEIAFPFDHALRSRIENNWNIVKKTVSTFTADQQAMIRDIFTGLHSAEY